MEIIGKSTLHPLVFYTGKIAGYFTWVYMFLSVINIFDKITLCCNRTIAFILLFIGLVFVMLSLFNLGKSTRFGLPTNDTVFTTKGLYKISRNPMYVGIILLTIAPIIYTLNIFIILLGIYSIIVYHFIILKEEEFLENRFGKAYTDYKKKVRRYL